ncbi:MAG: hypothetical protein EOP87_11945, partial [Verrucomicrobiaceae bacterium]
IIAALASLDAQGTASPREAADWIERLEVSQNPGVAAVQVMTIHKSKGLGFDVVILPEVPNDSIPSAQYFDVAEGAGWITQTPPKWARELIPEMREAEEAWNASQRYEAFCMLYVALTRSKRGLYVLLEPPAASQDADKPSLANWLARSVSSDGQPGTVYQSGSPDWVESISAAILTRESPAPPPLPAAVPRRERVAPSSLKPREGMARSVSGTRFGNEVHAAFEQVAWLDGTRPALPLNEAGRKVAALLEIPGIRKLFERSGPDVELLREQPVDSIVGGKWLSGTIDRLHLHRDGSGTVIRVEVIDFKTDAVSDQDELLLRHAAQMDAYQEVMGSAYPGADVVMVLVSTSLGQVITL